MLTTKDHGRVMTLSFWSDFLSLPNWVKGKMVSILAALIATTLAGIGIAFASRPVFRPGNSSLAVTRASSSPQNTKGQKQPVESVMITLRTFGFEPNEISRKAGPVFFFVTNASGFRQVNFRLDREAGARLKDVPLPLGKFRWQEVINLTPGTYLLRVDENPQWVCRITITPR
jgi:hypothetical protein